jgi:hypothetical protein
MNAHKTAIKRKKMSAPAYMLHKNDMIIGRTLDYGSGHGFDANALGIDQYDPHHSPKIPPGTFNTIICTYVLNVIPDFRERMKVLSDIRYRLADGGKAYISVRNDLTNLNGWTKIGTWQGKIELDLPIVYKTAGFVTYLLEK